MTVSDKLDWRPPSDRLVFRQGLWQVGLTSPVSYPESGNEVCFQVEDDSYWFRHRNECILEAVSLFPPNGTIFDIGGGNGFVALGLQNSFRDVVLVEPGNGSQRAMQRGVKKVICATLADASFYHGSLAAASAFDVIEHLPDDIAFLRQIRGQLAPGGRFYCTVPAGNKLWSNDDIYSGHYRRYNEASLCQTMRSAGFAVEFVTYFFTWLTLPVLLCRVLPSRLHFRDTWKLGSVMKVRSDHHIPRPLAGLINGIQTWELRRLKRKLPLKYGTSLLCVARATSSHTTLNA